MATGAKLLSKPGTPSHRRWGCPVCPRRADGSWHQPFLKLSQPSEFNSVGRKCSKATGVLFCCVFSTSQVAHDKSTRKGKYKGKRWRVKGMVSIQFLEGTVALVKWHDKDIGNKFKLNFNLNGISQVSWGFLFCFVLFCFESLHKGFPDSSDGKKYAYNAVGTGSVPGSVRSPGKGYSNPLQYSCLEKSQRNLVGYSPWGPKSQAFSWFSY